MSLRIGEIDIVQQTLESEFQIERLLRIVELIVNKADIKISHAELDGINNTVLKNLQRKYPHSGISFKNSEGAKDASDR